MIMRIVSVQVGQPQAFRDELGAWKSAIGKRAVAGPVAMGVEGLAGDAQADRQNHGGPHKAVLAYALAHYARWRQELGRELPAGGFGENFTLENAEEATVCVGDQWRIGELVLEVSQPRQPCLNPARYWHIPGLDQRMRDTGRTGWYLRMLAPGTVKAGTQPELAARPYPDWTIARVNRVFYRQGEYGDAAAARAAMEALAACPRLSPAWRERFARRAAEPRN